MSIIKTITLLISFCSLLCLGSCILLDPGGDDLGCPDYTYDSTLRTVTVDPTFGVWINPTSDKIVFVNSNGGRFGFSAVKSNENSRDEMYRIRGGVNERGCQYDTSVYCWFNKEDIVYNSNAVPFEIKLTRHTSLNSYELLKYQDSAIGKSEQIDFYVGNQWFSYYLSDTSSSYVDQYTLLDSVYHQVYVCKNTKVKQGLHPTIFFLQKGYGLIGFELSNKEVWAVKY